MPDLPATNTQAPPVGHTVGSSTTMPQMPRPSSEVEGDYAQGYRDGRLDAHAAAAIFIGLNGFRDTTGWAERFRDFVTGRRG